MENNRRVPLTRIGFYLAIAISFCLLGQTKMRNDETFSVQPKLVTPKFLKRAIAPKPKGPQWEEFSLSLAQVDRTDSDTLRSLEQRAIRFAKSDEESFQAYVLEKVTSEEIRDLRYAFFLVNVATQALRNPSPLFAAVLEKVAKNDESHEDSHHGGGPNHSLSLLKIHTLNQIGKEGVPTRAEEGLIATLKSIARSNPDLAQVRGSLQALKRMDVVSSEELEKIASSRSESERFAFEDLL